MEFKGIGRIAMCNFRIEVCGEVDDLDRFKWASKTWFKRQNLAD
jgi:hypothetical protein